MSRLKTAANRLNDEAPHANPSGTAAPAEPVETEADIFRSERTDQSSEPNVDDAQTGTPRLRTRSFRGRLADDATVDAIRIVDEDRQRKVSICFGLFSITRLANPRSSYWIHSDQAAIFFAAFICLNAIYIGFETEFRNTDDRFVLGWFFVESTFLAVFTVELVLRIVAERLSIFKDGFNILDMILVFTGIMDTWVIELLQAEDASKSVGFVTLLRIIRLLRLARILRMVRILRYVGELLLLLKGIFGAMRALIWSLILLLLIIYATAIFLTKMLGHRDDLWDDQNVQEWFGSLGSSMFTLFQLITLEGWNDVCRYIMNDKIAGPAVSLLVIAFILFTNLTLLNLVTGIILDHVMAVSRDQERSQSAKLELARAKTMLRLSELFRVMDSNGDGELTLEDLRKGFAENEDVRKELLKLDVGILDVNELFDILDINGSGSINVTEFVDGALRAVGPASAKHLLTMHFDLFKMWEHMLETMDNMRGPSPATECQGEVRSDIVSLDTGMARQRSPGPLRTSSPTAAAAAPGNRQEFEDRVERRLLDMEARLGDEISRRFDALERRLERAGVVSPVDKL